ncbi:zinc-binding dehydrogenase [Streptomyces sp. NBC_00076]|uniref:zinc-binding dehydrogenase n=1 Tax=Streptomyces sp. NBC_00076 TaxID=2975642 RepID=UPI003254DCC0
MAGLQRTNSSSEAPIRQLSRRGLSEKLRQRVNQCAGRFSEASRASGVSARSLRHYEDEGLIVPGRCSNGFRDCFEAAGEIVGIGPDVEGPLPLGTHVVGAGPGAFAQYMTMPTAAALPVPAGWSDIEALGPVLNWATALAALKPLGEIKTGDVVLVHAAAGGVGQAAVRLARHYGARVIATASPAKHDTVKELGADAVLDSTRPDLAEEITRMTGGVDLVLESVGQATFKVSLSVTKPFTGRIVVFGAASGDATLTTHDLVFPHQVQVKGLHIGALAAAAPSVYQSFLVEIEALIAQGVYPQATPSLKPGTGGVFVVRVNDEVVWDRREQVELLDLRGAQFHAVGSGVER